MLLQAGLVCGLYFSSLQAEHFGFAQADLGARGAQACTCNELDVMSDRLQLVLGRCIWNKK